MRHTTKLLLLYVQYTNPNNEVCIHTGQLLELEISFLPIFHKYVRKRYDLSGVFDPDMIVLFYPPWRKALLLCLPSLQHSLQHSFLPTSLRSKDRPGNLQWSHLPPDNQAPPSLLQQLLPTKLQPPPPLLPLPRLAASPVVLLQVLWLLFCLWWHLAGFVGIELEIKTFWRINPLHWVLLKVEMTMIMMIFNWLQKCEKGGGEWKCRYLHYCNNFWCEMQSFAMQIEEVSEFVYINKTNNKTTIQWTAD